MTQYFRSLRRLLILAAAAVVICPAQGVQVADFLERSFTNSSNQRMPYRLYVPRNLDPSKSYPLVVFFHGYGNENGTDNRNQVTQWPGCMTFATYQSQRGNPCFVLIPQHNVNEYWVQRATSARAVEVINQLLTEFPEINPRRVYGLGLSDGGHAVFRFQEWFPGVFAAGGTLGGDPLQGTIDVVGRWPIWMALGAQEDAAVVQNSKQLFQGMQNAGGVPRLTLYPSAGHLIFNPGFFDEPDLASWFFQFESGTVVLSPPANLRFSDIGNGSVTLEWDPPGEGEPAPIAYEIFRDDVSLGKVTRQTYDGNPTHSFTDTGASAGTTYRYKVKALSPTSDISESGELVVSVPIDSKAPVISKTGGGLTSVSVLFDEPVEASVANPQNFKISPRVQIQSATLGGDLRTVTLQASGLEIGREYSLSVSAVSDRATPKNTATLLQASFVNLPSDGQILWLRGSSDAIQASDSSRIYQWQNEAFLGGYSARQRVSGNGPRAVGWNGGPTRVAEFGGDGTHLRLDEGMEDFSRGLSCLSVVKPKRRARDLFFQFGIGAGVGSGTPALLEAISFGRDNLQKLYFETCSSTSLLRVTSPSPVDENRAQVVGVVERALNSLLGSAQLFLDGNSVASGTVYLPKTIRRTDNFIGRGTRANVDSIDGYLRSQMAEIVLYNRALTSQERLGIEGYLYRKWVSDGVTNRAPLVELASIAAQSFISGQSSLTIDLSAAVTDDDLPSNTLQQGWSIKSAPAYVEIASPSSRVTTARIVAPGTYRFEFFADDGALRTSKEVSVVIGGLDKVPPELILTQANGSNTKVLLRFSEDVEAISAANAASYTIDPGVTVTAAELLADKRTVVLTVSPMEVGKSYTIRSRGVKDLSESRNESDSSRTFAYSNIYLSDNFDNDFEGWIPVDQGTVEPFSIWKIISGAVRESSNMNDNSDSNNARLGTFLLWSDELAKQWTSYQIEADLRSTDDDGIGLMVYYQDPDNYYRFEMDAQRGFRKLIRKKNGIVTLLASESQGYVIGKSYRASVDVNIDGIRVQLDGTTLFGGRINDTTLTRGSVALFSWGNTGAYFDNVRVTFAEKIVTGNDLTKLGLTEMILGTGNGYARMFNDGTLRLNVTALGFGSGSDSSSNLYLQEATFVGEFDMQARIAKPLKIGAMAGLEARETLANGVALAMTFRSNGAIVLSDFRSNGPASETQVAQISGGAVLLRLKRSGETITAYYGTDGVTWQEAGHMTVDRLSPVAVGIVAASGSFSESATVDLDSFNAAEPQNGAFFEKDQYVSKPLPNFQTDRDILPSPILDGSPELVNLYWAAWEAAYRHCRAPQAGSQLVSNYIDEGFDGGIYQWDSTFMTAFARYAGSQFPGIESLDNFYNSQASDGYIPRSIGETSGVNLQVSADSVNPPLFAWAEWENYLLTGDRERLKKVALPLLKYGDWLEIQRRRSASPHGLFWNTMLGSGMDNTPRFPYEWIDMSSQMVMHHHYLAQILSVLGKADLAQSHQQRAETISGAINTWMWDAVDRIYNDLNEDAFLSKRKSIASFWPLLAKVTDRNRAADLVGHLRDTTTFNRLVPFPTLAADDPLYDALGDYWRGGVWAPTNYAVIKGLEQSGFERMAAESSKKYLNALSSVYLATGTFWENYAPDSHAKGNRAVGDFVGWTGVGPISLLLENVIGLEPNAPEGTLVWRIQRTDRHGVEHYHLGNNEISVIANERASTSDPVSISVENTAPLNLRVIMNDREITFRLTAGSRVLSTSDAKLKAPSSVQAFRTAATNVSLSWEDNNDSEDGYRIYRRSASDPVWDETTWQLVGETPANANTFSDLLPQVQETGYFYIVRAVSSDELSGPSLETGITTLAPVPSMNVSPNGVADVNEELTFDASGSTAPDGTVAAWVWDFGDGTASSGGVSSSHRFVLPGKYRVHLTVTSSSGLKKTISRVVEIQDKANLHDAMLIVGSATLNAAEKEMKHQLELRDFVVSVVTGAASSTSAAAAADLVVVAPSVASIDVNTKLRDIPVPVLVFENQLFDDMGMTGTETSEYGNLGSQTKVSVLTASHPLAAGLPAGSHIVYIQSTFVTWGHPNENAIKVASVEGDPSKVVIFGYEKGSQMEGMVAPERRLGFFLENEGAGLLTGKGVALLDAALDWLVNSPPDVRIVSPMQDEDFVADDEITLSADASDRSDVISKVEFFDGSTSLGSVATAPYSITTAGLVQGTHVITAVATDARGSSRTSAPISINIIPGTALELWKHQHFTLAEREDPEISGDNANPDGDQLSNLLEFAFNQDPKAADAASVAIGNMIENGQTYLTLTYTRPKNASGLKYRVEVSDDLQTWHSGSTATAEISRVDNGRAWVVTVRDMLPMGSASRRFMRVSVETSADQTSYLEDFDSFTAGFGVNWEDKATFLPWYAARTQYRASSGEAGSLDLASFTRPADLGADGGSERALGASHHLFGEDDVVCDTRFVSKPDQRLTHFHIAFDREQWRRASVTDPAYQTLTCEYAADPSGLATGACIPFFGATFHSMENLGIRFRSETFAALNSSQGNLNFLQL